MTDHSNTHPHHASHVAVGVALTAIGLTLGFHFLLASHPFGVALVLFVALLVIGMHVLAVLSGRQGNPWAYAFLLPVMFASAAEVLYASDVVRGVGLLLIFSCLSLFAYWLFAPRLPLHTVPSFFVRRYALETLWPFGGVPAVFHRLVFRHRLTPIVVGALIALPFLVVISLLFASADPLFNQAAHAIFAVTTLRTILNNFLRDGFVFLYFVGAGWTMLERVTRHVHEPAINEPRAWDQSVLTTFLVLLNALFVSFLAFQGAYFFGGQDFLAAKGINYAEYARSGFYELMSVSLLVFGIAWMVYRWTAMRWRASRILLLLLIAQTVAILISAVMRLSLYIQAYGLSVARWWAAAAMGGVAVALLVVFGAALARLSYGRVAKGLTLAGVWIFSLLLLVNVEDRVAAYNIERFLSGQSAKLDYQYLTQLSTDAMPRWIGFLNTHWPTEDLEQTGKQEARVILRAKALETVVSLQRDAEEDWRNLVWSDYRAMAAAANLK